MKEPRSSLKWKQFDEIAALHDAALSDLRKADDVLNDATNSHDEVRSGLDQLKKVYTALTTEHGQIDGIAARKAKGRELVTVALQINALSTNRTATGAALMTAIAARAAVRRTVKMLEIKRRLALRAAQLNDKAEKETTDHEFNVLQRRKARRELQAEKDAATIRQMAVDQNAPQFGGLPRALHPDLSGQRWTDSGNCTGCSLA